MPISNTITNTNVDGSSWLGRFNGYLQSCPQSPLRASLFLRQVRGWWGVGGYEVNIFQRHIQYNCPIRLLIGVVLIMLIL